VEIVCPRHLEEFMGGAGDGMELADRTDIVIVGGGFGAMNAGLGPV
jgi:hypothetical protein